MKRKKDKTLCLQRQSKTKEKMSNDDDFQGTPLLRKGKSVHTSLKAAKEDTSAPDLSNAVTSKKTYMPAVNKDTSTQDVLPAPIPSTSRTFTPIKTRLLRLKHLKRKKKRTIR
ncbi:hypothetical protein RMCBS344292_18200 [Rhizopus microsporus]|nr:hypothetical protein RMCBS344292_18200 [Rhizopus microsporus]